MTFKIADKIKARNERMRSVEMIQSPYPYAAMTGTLTSQIEWLGHLIDIYGDDILKAAVAKYIE